MNVCRTCGERYAAPPPRGERAARAQLSLMIDGLTRNRGAR